MFAPLSVSVPLPVFVSARSLPVSFKTPENVLVPPFEPTFRVTVPAAVLSTVPLPDSASIVSLNPFRSTMAVPDTVRSVELGRTSLTVSLKVLFEVVPFSVTAAANASSTLLRFRVSPPLRLTVSEPVGLANVTLSPSVESIVVATPAALVSSTVSAPPVKVKTRSVTLKLSMTGSSPV